MMNSALNALLVKKAQKNKDKDLKVIFVRVPNDAYAEIMDARDRHQKEVGAPISITEFVLKALQAFAE